MPRDDKPRDATEKPKPKSRRATPAPAAPEAPEAAPAANAAAKPATRSAAAKPATKPAAKPATKPATTPAAKSAAKRVTAVTAAPPAADVTGAVSGASASAAEQENSATRRALLAFLSDWRQLQQGEITAGGSLVVHYDPARFPVEDPAGVGAVSCDIIGYARFLPGGELRHAALVGLGAGNSPVPDDGSISVAAEIPVPPESEVVELWFQRTDAAGATDWDSRFGENYRFGVVRQARA